MDKIKEFFNSKAQNWDKESIADGNKIKAILNISDLTKDLKILDVACGTGVLEEFLSDYSPKKIKAIDISENMIKVAKEKYSNTDIEFLCEDLHNLKDETFDYIIIYNAFPHFLDQKKTINHIYKLLVPGGTFVICHGTGRKNIDAHHKKVASEISLGLQPAIDNAILLKDNFHIKTLIDKEDLYVIYSIKKSL
ncbi:class I SAM-dependent methyltransferase [uncultured Clostridium sp.]|uniref:class I SAM-dependent methyltransferase n=1 Tax=uncultured Clostridium sp. TaxID=59620 RepID=UPI002636A544|nr:class I SAM-dependent methyltransferase [uncultured Clostridium sp.]